MATKLTKDQVYLMGLLKDNGGKWGAYRHISPVLCRKLDRLVSRGLVMVVEHRPSMWREYSLVEKS